MIEVIQKSSAKYSTTDRKKFFGVECNADTLDSGVFRTRIDFNGNTIFEKIDEGKAAMLKFPSDQQRYVIDEINDFWKKEADYKKMGLSYKRGVLLYGPQGSGKTSVIKTLIHDLVAMGGIVIDFRDPRHDIQCIQFFRKAEPTRPLMIVMEDIDAMLTAGGEQQESHILNMLDGVNQIEHVVFLATTNHPEKLEERITDRPSRFDRVIPVDLPEDADREFYLKHLIEKFGVKEKVDLGKWVKETHNLSVAHLKELVLSVFVYKQDYKTALFTLDKMKKTPKVKSSKKGLGFGAEKD